MLSKLEAQVRPAVRAAIHILKNPKVAIDAAMKEYGVDCSKESVYHLRREIAALGSRDYLLLRVWACKEKGAGAISDADWGCHGVDGEFARGRLSGLLSLLEGWRQASCVEQFEWSGY